MKQPIPAYLFLAWSNMFRRCYYVDDPSFKHYGGRGIRVARRWNNIEAFIRDVGPRPSPKHSLDRIDNDGPYGPKNCRWATVAEQLFNRRITLKLTWKGITAGPDEWARRTGINVNTIRARLRRAWPVELILTTRDNRIGHRVRQRNATALCEAADIPLSTFYWRLKQGLSEDEALRQPKQQGHRLKSS